ncbi:monovalent cation/H+ antiporter complex subunit F [Oceanispirochaeta sp.]|jgi:multicomponent Na+:H+ antiporter subunit F|uniref:monovalent cation/H+ antiporter complex subunit F n=1 Tax=Oceanispirochaeta sp. TaxID=2035350 RepID=UPI002632B633|nr:monovalent cation/H+ antiporter complex subunit F [Oceanispirochaeta sp.]MDA3957082.1 monovalent cation/H+ antiporter complex subunit F [Oceanispirochaeta sp.]
MRMLMLEFMQWFLLACAFMCVIRLVTGKNAADKLAGLNVLSGVVLAFMVLHGVQLGRALYLDVALVYDIFGFLGFLAIAHFLKNKIPGEEEK